PDQSAGQLTGMFASYRDVSGVRTAETHWHTEALRAAERDIGAELAGWGDEGEREQVGAERHQRPALVCCRGERGPVDQRATGPGQLGDHPEELAVGQSVAQVGGDDFDAQGCG